MYSYSVHICTLKQRIGLDVRPLIPLVADALYRKMIKIMQMITSHMIQMIQRKRLGKSRERALCRCSCCKTRTLHLISTTKAASRARAPGSPLRVFGEIITSRQKPQLHIRFLSLLQLKASMICGVLLSLNTKQAIWILFFGNWKEPSKNHLLPHA